MLLQSSTACIIDVDVYFLLHHSSASEGNSQGLVYSEQCVSTSQEL